MKLALLGVLLVLGAPVYSAQLDRGFTLDFYRRVLSCAPLTISCLQGQGLIKELGPNLYAFNDRLQLRHPDEAVSGGRLARVLDRPVVLIPDLPGLIGVPTVDAMASLSRMVNSRRTRELRTKSCEGRS